MIADLTTDPTPARGAQVEHGLSPAEKTARIDLGLALLQVAARPGVALSRADIAAWCGCSETAIQDIEHRALRKLRARTRQHPVLREFTPAP